MYIYIYPDYYKLYEVEQHICTCNLSFDDHR